MTVCRQLNYLYRATTCLDYSETLILDGEISGRNWSLVKRTWLRNISFHGCRDQYYMRLDVSEYHKGYDELRKTVTADDIASMLSVSLPVLGNVRFFVHNMSPGLWENGFNPNVWLSTCVWKVDDEEDVLRHIVETGIDPRDPEFFREVVVESVDRLKPFIDVVAKAAPPGVPYKYWWGEIEPPPPRKPVY